MIPTVDLAVLIAAGLFAVYNGVNDGGSLLVTSLKMDALRPLTAAALLSSTVVVAPIIFGTQVATTLADRLVSFRGQDDQLALLVVVLGATVVVVALSRAGVPTSLTLALIGAILGVGLGGRMAIAWNWVVVVLVLAALAPFAGLAGAFAISRLWGGLPLRTPVGRQVRYAHRMGFVLQAFAYGTNDGQKMLAVFVLAVPIGVGETRQPAPVWMLVTVGVLFAIGMLLGVRRYGARLEAAVGSLTPVNAVSAQLSSGASVIASAAAGAPVSMTQTVTGALIGGSLTEGTGRVRWNQAAGIAAAWFVTLPVAALVTAVPAIVLLRP